MEKTEKGFFSLLISIVKHGVVLKTVLPVLFAIALSLIINALFPGFENQIQKINYQGVNLIIVFCVFVMLATTVQKIDFSEVKLPSKKYYFVMHSLTWIVKPLLQFLCASFFFYVVFKNVVGFPKEYTVGMTLMALAPCTVMVMLWSFLSNGSLVHAYLSTLVNVFLIATIYPILGYFYLGAVFFKVSYFKILYATAFYFVAPSLLGLIIKKLYKSPNMRLLTTINISALSVNVFTLFTLWSSRLRHEFLDLAIVSVPTLVRIILVVALIFWIIKKFEGRDAAKSASIIGTSDNIELAIVVYSVLFGLQSPVFLPVLANILMELPTMIFLVAIFLVMDIRKKEKQAELEVGLSPSMATAGGDSS
jgi:ACR3 family arsenite transporter